MDQLRVDALLAALDFHENVDGDFALTPGESRADTYARLRTAVLETADDFLCWLRGPNRLLITFGQVIHQNTLLPTGNHNAGGTVAQLHDNEQVDITVVAVDAKGFESADALTYAVGDETICTVVGATDEDSHTATIVAGNPGSTTVTVTDPTAVDPATSQPIFATIAVDVLPAGAVTITVTEGTPVPQA